MGGRGLWVSCVPFLAGVGDFPPSSGQVGPESGEVQVAVPEAWAHFSCLPPLKRAAAPNSGNMLRQGSACSLCPLPPLDFLCQMNSSLS